MERDKLINPPKNVAQRWSLCLPVHHLKLFRLNNSDVVTRTSDVKRYLLNVNMPHIEKRRRLFYSFFEALNCQAAKFEERQQQSRVIQDYWQRQGVRCARAEKESEAGNGVRALCNFIC